MPDNRFTMDNILNSKKLKLIRNNNRVYFGEVVNRKM